MRFPLAAAILCLAGAGLLSAAVAQEPDPDDLPRAGQGGVAVHGLPEAATGQSAAGEPAAGDGSASRSAAGNPENAETGKASETSPSPETPAAAGALPPPPLASVGRAVREALKPASKDEPVAAPQMPGKPKPPPQAEASELSLYRDQAAIAAFYAARNDAPLWVNKWGLEPRALAVIAEVERSAYWGLERKDFEVPSQIGRAHV